MSEYMHISLDGSFWDQDFRDFGEGGQLFVPTIETPIYNMADGGHL